MCVCLCLCDQTQAYWPPLESSTATATCWLAVTDSTRENGCMRFIKGSHKEPKLRMHFPGEQMNAQDTTPHLNTARS